MNKNIIVGDSFVATFWPAWMWPHSTIKLRSSPGAGNRFISDSVIDDWYHVTPTGMKAWAISIKKYF